MDQWVTLVMAIVGSFLASGGLWSYILHRDKSKSATTRLLMGLAYRELVIQGMGYLEREWITEDELGDYRKYFYEPYKELGGNGVAERIMNDVAALPLKNPRLYFKVGQHRQKSEDFHNDRRQAPSRNGTGIAHEQRSV